MLTHLEQEEFEKAFFNFLIRFKRKNEIKVKYYDRPLRNGIFDYAYIGYVTSKGGFHGIHFSEYRNDFYFGVRNMETGASPRWLNYSLQSKIPALIKEAMKGVATERSRRIIKRPDDGWGT
jgi:hypothetical protein